MKNVRVKFKNKRIRKKFFKELQEILNSKTLPELAKKLQLPLGRLKQWYIGTRTIPLSVIEEWSNEFGINLDKFDHKQLKISDILKKASKKGVKKLEEKYGKHWYRIIGKSGKKKLEKILHQRGIVYEKWRNSIKLGLKKRFGKEFYRKIGKLGGKISISKIAPEKLKKQLMKAFKKSFKKRLTFNDQQFRSKKEIEVAILLQTLGLKYQYEKRLFNYFPDFVLSNKTIIEVVGFEWEPHIQRTKEKINKFLEKGYKVIVYTYPNMEKYFKDLPIKIISNIENLKNSFLDISGRSSAHPGHVRS